MSKRWILLGLVLLGLSSTGCGEATVRPFVEAAGAGGNPADGEDGGVEDGGDDDDGDDDGADDDGGIDDDLDDLTVIRDRRP